VQPPPGLRVGVDGLEDGPLSHPVAAGLVQEVRRLRDLDRSPAGRGLIELVRIVQLVACRETRGVCAGGESGHCGRGGREEGGDEAGGVHNADWGSCRELGEPMCARVAFCTRQPAANSGWILNRAVD
jgi:hypothetical protein